MKKRIVVLALLLSMAVTAVGCGADKDKKKDSAKTEETSAEAEEKEEEGPTIAEIIEGVDLEKCVTLGEYKGIEVEKTIQAVSDDEVQAAVQNALKEYPVEVKDRNRKVEEGDTVNINFEGFMDGEAFEGGSAENYDLKIGSGQFIAGFEDGLIGAKKGEVRELNLTFPEDYTEGLSGKDVQFKVTINSIKESLEEPTDEWVAANIEGYYTVEEYEAGIRSEQEETNADTAQQQAENMAWNQVIDGSTINEYPDELVKIGEELYEEEAKMYAGYAGMELEAYVESSGITMDEYKENKTEYGKNIAAQALICAAICEKEGYAIGDDGYKEAMKKILDTYGVSEEEWVSNSGRDNVEQRVQLSRVLALIMDNANVKEVSADAATIDEEQAETEAGEENTDSAEDAENK